MSRTRTVFDPSMVAHLWANRSQDAARNSGDTFYFRGPSIFSYGNHFVIAHHMDGGRVLWNDDTYGVTTSKHQNHAWRALSRSQNENRVHVPALNDDYVRNLESCRTSSHALAGKLPKLAERCAEEVISLVQSIAGMRSADKMNATLARARMYEASGRALCEYAKQGRKAAPRWPVPALPESVPADKAERATWIRSIAKGELLAQSARAMDAYRAAIAEVREVCADAEAADYRTHNLLGRLNTAGHELTRAAKAYESATGRALPRLKAHRADIAALEVQATAMRDAATVRAHADSFQRVAVKHARIAHSLRRAGRVVDVGYLMPRAEFKARELTARNRQASSDAPRMREAFDALQRMTGDVPQWGPLVNRVYRMAAWHEAEKGLERAQSLVISARSYVEGSQRLQASQGRDTCGMWRDATREYRRALEALHAPSNHGRFCTLHAAAIDALRREAGEYVATAEARTAAENAARIADWIAGTSSVRPDHDAGTFARINGRIVETSRGAHVPIEHACRLARIARRVIAQGGRTWADGEGPRVGHFQVTSIGADGAAVIGCHEFSAAESMRILALLESCADCAHVSDETAIAA